MDLPVANANVRNGGSCHPGIEHLLEIQVIGIIDVDLIRREVAGAAILEMLLRVAIISGGYDRRRHVSKQKHGDIHLPAEAIRRERVGFQVRP